MLARTLRQGAEIHGSGKAYVTCVAVWSAREALAYGDALLLVTISLTPLTVVALVLSFLLVLPLL